MNSVLTTLPGVHASIIGFCVAFFSVYILYAYQKIFESNKDLLDSFELANAITNPSNTSCNLSNKTENSDWDKFKRLIKDTTGKYSYTQDFSNHDEVEKTIQELNEFFSLFFISYPFNFKKNILINDSGDFEKRMYAIKIRINYLKWTWENHQSAIIKLYAKYDLILKEKEDIRIEKEIKEYINGFPQDLNLTGIELKSMREPIEQTNQFDETNPSSNRVHEFFSKIEYYFNKIIPEINKNTQELYFYKNIFNAKKYSKFAIVFISYILLIGILIPILLIPNYRENCFIFDIIIYTITALSFLPYFILFFHLWKKTKFL